MQPEESSSLRLALLAIERLQAGAPVPREVGLWLAAGLRAWLEDSGEASLHDFLDLDRPTRLQWRRWQQRRLLRRAAELLEHNPDSWAAARALSAAAAEFEEKFWPAWRDLKVPPAQCSELRATLFAVFRLGVPIPRSTRNLYRRLSQDPDCWDSDRAG